MKIFRKRIQPDHQKPCPPYFLKAEDLFVRKNGTEIFVKKISSTRADSERGKVIAAPGIAMNPIAFMSKTNGETFALNHDESFANLLAANGFEVYLYYPSYTERVHNRYISKYCPQSIYYKKSYDLPSTLTFDQMVNQEVPMVIDFVCQGSKEDSVSWIGFSMGGMLMYAYLSKYEDGRIKNVITIGSPVSLTQIITRMIARMNMLSKALGLEEKTIFGLLSENFVPLTRMISALPGWVLRLNFLAATLYNPANIRSGAIKTFFGKVVEPIPAGLENNFAYIIQNGFSSQSGDFNYLNAMYSLRNRKINWLFFYGNLDLLAPPNSVQLAHEIISPDDKTNIMGIPLAGHIDLLIGRRSPELVWQPSLEWLKSKTS